ncbi:MAG: hypothetical protein H6557_07575 [Lewinellaceae bacterium]|nr:hypothetical protein [Phaeodactylibacter sp.]MCB9036460.1 hypothetical protein [Lewinellaceae bacterium]
MVKTMLFPVLALLLSISFLVAQPSSPDWLGYDPSSGQFRLRQPPPLNGWPEAKEKPSWGIYLWEFGDGHYSFEEEPEHRYAERGSYQVRLHLTPFYATNDPVSLQERIEAPGKAKRTPIYDLGGKKALLESNSSDYIVPEQAFQLVTHYEAPTGFSGKQGGYLFVFYNKKKEINLSLLYNAFELTGERTHYQEESLSENEVLPLIAGRLNGERQTAALELANQYKGKLAYRVENMGPGEQRRLFLSLFASKHLKSQQDKNRELTVAMLWVPDSGNFRKEEYSAQHKMQILAVYDPNRIRVQPRIAHFRKGYPKTLHYRVEFQNKEEGRVRDVTVNVPVDKSLNLASVRLGKMDPVLPACPQGYAGKDLSCIEISPVRGLYRDTVRVTLRNAGLEGTKAKGFFQSKKSTKGFVEFDIETAEQKVGANRVRAYIVFDEVDPVETRNAKTQWRHRAAYFRPGFSMGATIKGFDSDASGLGGRINLAFGVQDAPITTGTAYGVELGFSSFRFTREIASPIENLGTLPAGSQLVSVEHARLNYLEARAWGGYQLNGWLRGYAGAGISVPASGKVEVQSSINNPDSDFMILQEAGRSRFGLLQSKEPLSVFDSESDLRNSMGLTWQFGVEAGLLDIFTLGLNQEIRFYPKFYHQECASLFNWQAYLRVRLFPVGGKL